MIKKKHDKAKKEEENRKGEPMEKNTHVDKSP